MHGAAKGRTEHLGLSSLDLQAMEDQRQRDHSAAVAAGKIPKNLIQRPRDTVSSFLGRTAQSNHFRIEALTAEFFEPLEAMLGQKAYLLAAEDDATPSSIDCIALGYLSLALVPEMSFPWLRDAMRAKAPLLSAYTERLRRRCFGDAPVDIAHAFAPESAPESPISWRAPGRISVAAVGTTLLSTLADSTPFLREIRKNNGLKKVAQSEDSGLSSMEKRTLNLHADSKKKDMYVSIATVVGGVALMVGYMMQVGMLSFHTDDEEELEEENGEASEAAYPTVAEFLGV